MQFTARRNTSGLCDGLASRLTLQQQQQPSDMTDRSSHCLVHQHYAQELTCTSCRSDFDVRICMFEGTCANGFVVSVFVDVFVA